VDVYARNNIKIVGAADGPLIVLAHGFGCDQQLWRLVVDRLKTEFRLLLIDHVGSGESDPASWDAEEYSSLTGYAADVVDIVRELDPTLVIECAQDAIAPREVGSYVHEHIPDSRLVTLDATGHCPQVSAPDATASAIPASARST